MINIDHHSEIIWVTLDHLWITWADKISHNLNTKQEWTKVTLMQEKSFDFYKIFKVDQSEKNHWVDRNHQSELQIKWFDKNTFIELKFTCANEEKLE